MHRAANMPLITSSFCGDDGFSTVSHPRAGLYFAQMRRRFPLSPQQFNQHRRPLRLKMPRSRSRQRRAAGREPSASMTSTIWSETSPRTTSLTSMIMSRAGVSKTILSQEDAKLRRYHDLSARLSSNQKLKSSKTRLFPGSHS